jgi:hypothetical protein
MKKILITMMLLAVGGNAFALSGDDAMVREYTKKANSEYVLPGNATLLKITYVGASTQAAVNIAADAFTTQAPIGTADLSYDLSNAAYDTLGEFCDALNLEDDYNCVLTGGKRDDDSSLLIDVTAASTTDAKLAGGYSVEIDTAGVVSADNTYINRLGITPEAGKRVVLKYCNVQSDAIGTLKIYGKLAKFAGSADGVTRNDSTLVASMATADDTAEVDGNIYGGNWIEFAKDEHVVISVGNASTAQTATSFIECFWDEK